MSQSASAQKLLQEAFTRVQAGDLDKALEIITGLLSNKHPPVQDAWFLYGLISSRKGAFHAGLLACERELMFFPENAQAQQLKRTYLAAYLGIGVSGGIPENSAAASFARFQADAMAALSPILFSAGVLPNYLPVIHSLCLLKTGLLYGIPPLLNLLVSRGEESPSFIQLSKEFKEMVDEAISLLPEEAQKLHGRLREKAPTLLQSVTDEISSILSKEPGHKGAYFALAVLSLLRDQPSASHELLWEEVRYNSAFVPAFQMLELLDRNIVLEDYSSKIEQSHSYTGLYPVLNTEVVHYAALPGSLYLHTKPIGQDLSRNMGVVAALDELQFGRTEQAVHKLIEELARFPTNQKAKVLLEQLLLQLPPEKTKELQEVLSDRWKAAIKQRPYVVMTSGSVVNRYGRMYDVPPFMLRPVMQQLQATADVTLITGEGREGVQGRSFVFGPMRVDRKPQALVVMRPWWLDEAVAAVTARDLGIPVVVLFYGATLYATSAAASRATYRPGSIGCVWSRHDYMLTREYHDSKEPLIITGNPMFDPIFDAANFSEPKISGLPSEYCLVLTSTHGNQSERVFRAAQTLSQQIPVVIKTHPLEPDLKKWSDHWPTFSESKDLLELIYRATFIVSPVSSSLIPAIHLQKKIIILREDDPEFPYQEIRDRYKAVFNFVDEPEDLPQALRNAFSAPKEYFEQYGHYPDGKAAERVANVVNACL